MSEQEKRAALLNRDDGERLGSIASHLEAARVRMGLRHSDHLDRDIRYLRKLSRSALSAPQEEGEGKSSGVEAVMQQLAAELEDEAASIEAERKRQAESAMGTTQGFAERARAETREHVASRIREALQAPTGGDDA